MGQSKFKWIIIDENGNRTIFEGTFVELISNWKYGEPIAIVRGELV